jgi:molybdopterin synthase catalytic subunit
MGVLVAADAFDPLAEVNAYQQAHPELTGKFGGTAIFIGTMRDLNQGDRVEAMSLEHYPGMTEKYLEKVSQEAAERWQILNSLVIHRVGELRPNDPIVLVAVWSAHRAEAFDACRYIIDQLKTRAPFWKQETVFEGRRWVEKNT